MGMLTEDMTRLRDEILALRSARQGLIHDLVRDTMNRRADVSSMLASTSEALSAVAKATKADRLGSIADLKSAVAEVLEKPESEAVPSKADKLAAWHEVRKEARRSRKKKPVVESAQVHVKASAGGKVVHPSHGQHGSGHDHKQHHKAKGVTAKATSRVSRYTGKLTRLR
jgi:hypothetical protein